MELLPLIIYSTILIIGLIATTFGLFGTLIIFLCGLIISISTSFEIIGLQQLILLGSLYIIGEVSEFLLAYFGTRKFGATKASAWSAIAGAIFGTVIGSLIPGIGILIGSFIGLFLGAFLMELFLKKDIILSLKAGTGSILGRTASVFVKLAIAIGMCVIILMSIV